jgi:hypothetical protein
MHWYALPIVNVCYTVGNKEFSSPTNTTQAVMLTYDGVSYSVDERARTGYCAGFFYLNTIVSCRFTV